MSEDLGFIWKTMTGIVCLYVYNHSNKIHDNHFCWSYIVMEYSNMNFNNI